MDIKKILYSAAQDTNMIGYCVTPELSNASSGQLPLVLVCHDWSGCNNFAITKASAIAQLGYVGFALDLYGNGRCGNTTQEKSDLMAPLLNNRELIITRIQAAINVASSFARVDPQKIAVIGFCFGGMCAIDLLRSGAAICGVVSFHGLLNPLPDNLTATRSTAKLLLLHGYADTMVSPAAVLNLAEEMTALGVDWQINMYGHTMHAFSNPAAQDHEAGLLYHVQSTARSWQAMQYFLHEIFTAP